MAEFQVQAMADENKGEDLPHRGRVTQVCREWLLHEDQALAYRLQNEEYQSHLVTNRERNQQLRQDTPKARQEQLREDHEAAMAQTAYELALAQQEARDADLAATLALQLRVQEMEKKQQQEEQDQAYARSLLHSEEKEKGSVRQTREMRQVEREAAYLGINTGTDNVALLARKDYGGRKGQQVSEEVGEASMVSSDLSDLSDFCLQPNDDMDEEEQRTLQEEQDADQDGKRRGDLMDCDQLMAIEAQDRELAKVLQEQERAKAKKAREKARQKALQRKQTKLQQQRSCEEAGAVSRHRETGPHTSPLPGPSAAPPESPGRSSPTYASPDFPRDDPAGPREPPRGRQLQRPDSLDLPPPPHDQPRLSRPHHPIGKTNKPRLAEPLSGEGLGESSSSSSMERSPAVGAYTNIACAIDPTYQRRVRMGELAPSPHTTLQSSSSTSSSSSSSAVGGLPPSSVTSPISPLPPPVFDDDEDDDYPVPPYMPIQGQRRTASLEKNRRPKTSKDKSGGKDGCRQQ